MKKLAMKMLSLLLVLSLLLPTCVFAQPGQDEDGTPGTQSTTSEKTTTFTEGGNSDGDADVPTGGGNGDGNADTPTGGGNGDGDADTPAGGGNGDGDADVPTGGGNGDGTSKDENGGGNGDENSDTSTGGGNGDENADVSEEEAAPTVVEMEEVVLDLSDMDLPDNDELFAAYVEREFDRAAGGGRSPVLYAARSTTYGLTTEEAAVYNELKNAATLIANGTNKSTKITLTATYADTYSETDLAVTEIWDSAGNLTDSAISAAKAKIRAKFEKMTSRLWADCPYEFYWCDKRLTTYELIFSKDAGKLKVRVGLINFKVADSYRDTMATEPEYTVTSDLAKVSEAVTNAEGIVNTMSVTTDRARLEYFRDAICDRVEYNYAAAGSSGYGDPWQMIYVFDNDSGTNVVCEGYAKAFQYLCELAISKNKFDDKSLECYNVTGQMDGGNHMWNVVEVGNARYLVDVTNCDGGHDRNGLFLKVVAKTDDQTYTFTGLTTISGGTATYFYGTDMKDLFCEGYPTLRELQSIKIDTPPSKTMYAQGENFDKTGMVVTATYSDGSTVPVTGYTVEGGNNLTAGATSVTIKYAELDNVETATQTVTVTAKPALGGTVTITGVSGSNPKIGDTLTANTSGLNYGTATMGTLSYQWKAGGDNVGSNSDKYTVQVGDYNKTITVTVTNSNNTGSVSSTATAAVVKKDGPHAPTGSIAVKNITAGGFTYTAIAEQQYAITTNNIAPGTDSSEWKTETAGDVVVTGKNANTEYYIYTRFAETDEAYAGAASGGTKVKTRMSAAASEFTYSTKEAVYTGSANGATVSSSVHNSSEFTLKYNGADTAPTNVGKYTLTAVVTAHGDYAATTVELGTWEIKPKSIDVTWSTAALTYTGLAQAPTISSTSGAVSGETVSVGVKEVTKKTDASPAGSTYTAEAEILSVTGGQAKADNYVISSTTKTQTYTINAATITVNPGAFTDYTGVYDGNSHSIKVDTSKITTVNNQPITIKYGTTVGAYNLDAAPTATNVSESKTVYYKITAPNHEDKTGTATITINKANATITATTLREIVKNGVAEDISNWATCDSGATLTYTLVGSPSGITFDAANNKLTADASTTTTTFDIKVSAGSTSNYNAPATKTITVNVVNKAAAGVSIASVPTSKTYGDENFTVTADKTAPNGGTWSWSSSDSGILEIVAGANTATPTIKVKKADSTGATLTVTYTSATHYGTFTTGNIAVAQKDVTITGLGAENKVYDGNDTATVTGTAAVAGKVGSDNVTVTGGTATFADKNVGTGKTVTFTGYTLSGTAAGNYNLTAQPANVTAEITAKEVTVTGITATNRTYAKDNLEVTLNGGTLSGVISGDAVNVDLTNAKGKMANANAGNGKAVTVTGVALGGADKGNYRLKEQPTGVTVDIAQAGTPAAPTGLNGVKGNALSTVTLPSGWTWVDGSMVMNSVGSQTFKANYTDAAGNYANDTNVDVMVNVKDKTDVGGKISFNDGTLVYTGAGQRYETATISGITAGTGVTWTYGYTAGTGTLDGGLPKTVGTYTVTVTYEDNLNYGTKSVTLTITQATPTGAPKFTKITSSGKTLGDAALVKTVSGPGEGFSVAGTVEWVDGSGTALADSTSVEANKSYGWKFTPTDSNYKSISGSVVVYTVRRVSHSGGAAADSAAAAAQPTVYSGSRGESVKTLQAQLNAKGFNAGSVDGIFGKNTRAAVMAFQKANGLAADGIVGKLTWAKLYDTTAALPSASTTAGTQPMVYRGSRGDAVRKLQELLNKKGFDCGAVDGIFGSKTYAAVVAFQKANGLSADGIAGPLTWGKLG